MNDHRSGLRFALGLACALTMVAPSSLGNAAEIKTTTYEKLPADKSIVKVRFVGDYLQLDALAKRIDAEILRLERPFLYLLASKTELTEMRGAGLQPEFVDPKDFFERLVRVQPATDETRRRIRAVGGEFVHGEKDDAIYRLSLRQVDLLEQQDLKIWPIREGDLNPRFVEIEAPDEASVQLILSLGVDVFEARDGRIFGRAFDGTIEYLRAHGMKVELTTP